MIEHQISFHELIERAKAGDKAAFGEIYETHLTPVYRYAYIRLGNREEADDVTQETFLKALQSIDRYEVQGENFLPYLFTIARNLIINRSQKKQPQILPDDEINRVEGGEHADAFAEREELRETLRGAVALLSETEKEIIELRFYAERTYGEIAQLIDKKEDAIRQHVARAIKKMRVHLAQFE